MTPEERAKQIVSAWWEAGVINHRHKPEHLAQLTSAIRAAVDAEREACAVVAENEWAQTSGWGTPDFLAYQKACGRAAKAIRARGES